MDVADFSWNRLPRLQQCQPQLSNDGQIGSSASRAQRQRFFSYQSKFAHSMLQSVSPNIEAKCGFWILGKSRQARDLILPSSMTLKFTVIEECDFQVFSFALLLMSITRSPSSRLSSMTSVWSPPLSFPAGASTLTWIMDFGPWWFTWSKNSSPPPLPPQMPQWFPSSLWRMIGAWILRSQAEEKFSVKW